MLPHILTLNIGSSIMILWNLNSTWLCNGTKVFVKKLMPKGEDVLIQLISMIPTELLFTFKWLKFPGQSLHLVWLNLESPCFCMVNYMLPATEFELQNTLYMNTKNQKPKNNENISFNYYNFYSHKYCVLTWIITKNVYYQFITIPVMGSY